MHSSRPESSNVNSFRYKKSIFICADDFGLSESVNEGIVELLASNKISGASCMVSSKNIEKAKLEPYLDRLGLHLKLCNDKMLPIFLIRCITGMFNKETIFKKIIDQIELYKDIFGVLPSFIDGHQHVHVFRGVRHLLVKALKENNLENDIWIRSVTPALKRKAYLKATLLSLLSIQFNKLLIENGIKKNVMFAGFSSLSPKDSVREQMRYWLKNAKDGTVIMCHPAKKVKKPNSLEQRRFLEFSYLSNSEFQYDCAEFGVTICNKL